MNRFILSKNINKETGWLASPFLPSLFSQVQTFLSISSLLFHSLTANYKRRQDDYSAILQDGLIFSYLKLIKYLPMVKIRMREYPIHSTTNRPQLSHRRFLYAHSEKLENVINTNSPDHQFSRKIMTRMKIQKTKLQQQVIQNIDGANINTVTTSSK